MAITAGTVFVDVRANLQNFGRDLQRQMAPQVSQASAGFSRQFSAALTRVGGGLSRVGTQATRYLTVPLLAGGVAAVKLASDLEETQNKVRVIFGNMARSILNWSKTSIDRMGLAQQTALDMSTQFAAVFQAAGLGAPKVADLSQKFTQLAADMSSFFNVPAEEALMALRSGLVGEAEPLRRFGVLLSEAAVQEEAMRLGIAKAGAELTEQQKVIARTSLITRSLEKASGDYARTQGGVANRSRALYERIKELGASFGRDLLPVVQDGLKVLKGLVEQFMDLSPATRETILKVGALSAAFGPVMKVVGGLMRGLGGLIGAIPALGRAVTLLATTPMGLLVTAVGGAIAAFIAIRRHAAQVEEEIQGFTRQILRGIDPMERWRAAVARMGREERAYFQFWAREQGIMAVLQERMNEARRRAIGITRHEVNALLTTEGAIRQWSAALTNSNALTLKQKERIAALIGTLGDYGVTLTDSQKFTLQNFIRTGDWRSALQLLRNVLKGTDNTLKNYNAENMRYERQTDQSAAAARGMSRQIDLMIGELKRHGRELTADQRKTLQNMIATGRLREAVEFLSKRIREIPDKHDTKLTANTRDALHSINEFLHSVDRSKVTVDVLAKTHGIHWGQLRHAGGRVAGRGDVPIIAEGGEMMIRTPMTRDIEARFPGLLDALNREGARAIDRLRGMAGTIRALRDYHQGGVVSGAPHDATVKVAIDQGSFAEAMREFGKAFADRFGMIGAAGVGGAGRVGWPPVARIAISYAAAARRMFGVSGAPFNAGPNRTLNNVPGAPLSQHAFGNAVDQFGSMSAMRRAWEWGVANRVALRVAHIISPFASWSYNSGFGGTDPYHSGSNAHNHTDFLPQYAPPWPGHPIFHRGGVARRRGRVFDRDEVVVPPGRRAAELMGQAISEAFKGGGHDRPLELVIHNVVTMPDGEVLWRELHRRYVRITQGRS